MLPRTWRSTTMPPAPGDEPEHGTHALTSASTVDEEFAVAARLRAGRRRPADPLALHRPPGRTGGAPVRRAVAAPHHGAARPARRSRRGVVRTCGVRCGERGRAGVADATSWSDCVTTDGRGHGLRAGRRAPRRADGPARRRDADPTRTRTGPHRCSRLLAQLGAPAPADW